MSAVRTDRSSRQAAFGIRPSVLPFRARLAEVTFQHIAATVRASLFCSVVPGIHRRRSSGRASMTDTFAGHRPGTSGIVVNADGALLLWHSGT